MTIRLFALLLVLGTACANAAPPKTAAPVADIDVDALARAKDVAASAPLSHDQAGAAASTEAGAANTPPGTDEVSAPGEAADAAFGAEAQPEPPSAALAADDIDVDALARAKDVGAAAATGGDKAEPAVSAENGTADTQPSEPLSDASNAAPAAIEDSKATSSAAAASDAIDVDALARAKDVDAASAASATQGSASADEPVEEATLVNDAVPAQDGAASAEATPENQASEPPTTDNAAPAANEAAPTDKSNAAPAPSEIEKRQAQACEKRAKNLLDAAQKGDYKTATRDFDATMRSALPVDQFKAAWESLAQFGALQTRGQSHLSVQAGFIAVSIPLIFEKANLYAQIACNHDNQVAGFYVKPLAIPAS